MKKSVIQLILFFLVLPGIVTVIQYSIDACYKIRVHNKFSRLFNHTIDANIMIFGSSAAYHQFDTRIIADATGKSGYNMGGDGLSFVQYNALIREYLSYEQQCKYMILSCNFEELAPQKLISKPDLYLAYLDHPQVYDALHYLEPQKTFLARYLPGYKLTAMTKAYYASILFADKERDSLRGYAPISTTLEVPDLQRDLTSKHNCQVDTAIFAKLQRTIADITAKGIKVILVITPVREDSYRFIANADSMKSLYRSLCSKDVYLLDYSTDPIGKNKEYFYNYNHLNETGAPFFSAAFSRDLVKLVQQ